MSSRGPERCVRRSALLVASALVPPLAFPSAQTPPPLETARVPRPTNLRAAVRNELLALQLGKALCWDEQLGSDGRTACATCHHHAGADSRATNAIQPGADGHAAGDELLAVLRPRHQPLRDDADLERLALRPGDGTGEFKTPGLRNVELTGPYFHNGQFATLRQVVAFYNNGGDEENPELLPLNLPELDKQALVDFLISLTDERVRFRRAPFDHPSLSPVNATPLDEVGAGGAATPLPTFLGLSPFQGF